MNTPVLRLKEIGIDTDAIISRLGGNELLYWSICKKFVNDQNYKQFLSSLKENDRRAAEFYIHTLKGVAANLGFCNLQSICQSILSGLNQSDNLPLDHLAAQLTAEYDKIILILMEEKEL